MKKLILVAEDNRSLADIMKSALKFLGYDVVVTSEGLEAVESAISLQPDLIVLDMMMPKLDGFQAASLLRRHAETENIPVLAVTALSGSEHRKKCLASGCDDYLPKPFTPKQLTIAIERLLRERSPGKSEKLEAHGGKTGT
jgi:CheY-like chemotaxis protein